MTLSLTPHSIAVPNAILEIIKTKNEKFKDYFPSLVVNCGQSSWHALSHLGIN